MRRHGVIRLFWLLFLLALPFVSAAAEPDKKHIKRTEFHGQLSPFQFFEDSETVLVAEIRKGIVHISNDAGASWDKIEDVDKAVAIHLNPNDNEVAIILCAGDTHYITRNQGKKWTSFRTKGMAISAAAPFSFHASDSKKMILNTRNGGEHAAFYTDDGFKSEPELLRKDALQCMWAREKEAFSSGDEKIDKNRILCIAPQKGGSGGLLNQNLVYSDNLFKKETEVQIGDGRAGSSGFVSMVSAAKYVLAAKRVPHTSEMAMYTTTDGSEWHRALFSQQSIESDGYTVMESTEYSIRVDVTEGGGSPWNPPPMGTLFGSDSNGTAFTRLQDHTNRNPFGFVDYERLDNVQGVALTNVVSNAKNVLDRNDRKELQTRITFDDGRTFERPHGKRDEDRKGDLNLHGYSEMHNQGKVYSNKGAPGLLMGIGNVGDDLHDYEESNLWVSTNGGEDWFFGYEGPHKYEFLDSGAVLVAVSDLVETDHIKYSTNYGRDWKKLTIIGEDDKKFRAGVFTTIQDSTSTKVLLTALAGRGDDAALFVYSIDFDYLDLKKCHKGDFETWNAREKDGQAGCVMGQQQSFRRRKPDAECTVDKVFKEAQPEFKPCPCTEADFECDTGFLRSEDKKKCVPEKGTRPPRGECKNYKDTYKSRSGFRKIPGNACKKNDIYDKMLDDVERSCDESETTPSADDITSTVKVWEGELFGHRPQFRYLEKPKLDDGDDNAGDDYKDHDETVLLVTEGRSAWKTHDHGKTWKQLRDVEGALAIYVNPYEQRDAYITTASTLVYHSHNRAQSFTTFDVPYAPNDQGLPALRFHPKQRDWLIWTGCASNSISACDATAHRSLKRGDEWVKLVDEVGTCEFVWQDGRNTSEKLVFCAREDDRRKMLVASQDWFNEDTKTLFEDIANFATMSEFIVVASREGSGHGDLTLNASIDAQTFAPARWPPSLAPSPHEGFDGYTVLDSSSHAIFLHITVNGRREREYGTIVKSNSNGTNFVTSLDYVNRNTDGFVDFEKIQGIEGTAMANIVMNHEQVEKEGAMKQIQTRITHNDGADWIPLNPPLQDSEGKNYECVAQHKRPPECGLHLHGYTERRSPEDSYSSPSAVGLVLGIGNVGYELGNKRDGDTFLSRDGGLIWSSAMKGQYMWEFGDQGSIIVLVEERAPTNKIWYSLDQGRTKFQEWRFSEQEFEITDLSTVPSDGSLNFLLWGRYPSGRRDPVTINLDFEGVFKGKCNYDPEDKEKSDFELWTPVHPTQKDDCLFGHRAQYNRKKSTSTHCYIGPYVKKYQGISENCTCAAKDFECDYNYVRDATGVCRKVGEDRDPKEECFENPDLEQYYPVSGYRRIPGDTCEGGAELEYIHDPLPCPGWEDEYAKKHGTSGWLIFFIVLICVSGAAAIGWFIYQRSASGQLGRISLGGDDSSGGQTTRMRLPIPSFDTSSPFVRYPVVAISAVAAGLMAVPMVVVSGGKWIRDKFPGGRRGGYDRLGSDGPAWRGSGSSRTYRSRDSFARGRNWTGEANAESDLLGEESDEEA